MEWWILLGVALLAVVICAALRIRNLRSRGSEGKAGNIYPLW